MDMIQDGCQNIGDYNLYNRLGLAKRKSLH